MGIRPQLLGLGKCRERNSLCSDDNSEGHFRLFYTATAPSLERDSTKGDSRFFVSTQFQTGS